MRRSGKSIAWVLSAAVLCLVATAALAPAALASTWTGRQLTGEAAKATMFGASCPTTSFCAVVGGQNTVATSTDPSGPLADWDTAYVGAGALPTGPNDIFPGRQIRGVSCTSPSLCVAVSFEGLIYTSTDPTGGAPVWSVTDLDGTGPSTHLYGISCPSASFCAAAAGRGKVVTSTNPTGGASAWSTTQLEGPLELRGISCTSPSLCVAVGDNGEGTRPEPPISGEIVSSTNPLGGVWEKVQMPGAQGSLYGVSCPSSALCVTGNLLGSLTLSTNPTGDASSWSTTDGGGSTQITAVDCPSASQCVAVDNNGDVLTSTDPTGGPGAWTFTNVLPYPGVDETEANGMFGVSCPTTSFCAAAANKGQIFTSEDPFAPSPAAAQPTGKKKHKKRPKRPRVKIAAQPQPGIEIPGAKVTARFHFFAANHAQVRGFACKIDGRPLKRCRSPKAYRVGIGRHVFRVRAIGWTGLMGPPAVVRFKVCHLARLPECIGQHVPRTARR